MRGCQPFGLAALLLSATVSGLSFEAQDGKQRPTTKVISLLKGMQKEVEADGKVDDRIYDKFSCWCSANRKEKGESIKKAEAEVKVLKSRLESLLSKSQRLKKESENLEDEIAAKEASKQKATVLRNEQHEEYVSDKQRLSSDISAVENGITQLGEDTEASATFLQKQKMETFKPKLLQILKQRSSRISDTDRDLLESFLQEGPTSGSGMILGTLDGLRDDMTKDLKQLESTEASEKSSYEDLASAIDEEIKASTKQLENKKTAMVDNFEERVHTKETIKDTAASAASDKEFLADMEQKCADMDSQWEERSKTRAEEIEAISKAIETLDAEDAHAAFFNSFSPSFMQVSKAARQHRQLAAETLEDTGRKYDARLVTLALQAKIDGFTKVKKAMDDMVTALKKEQQDEVEQKRYCVKSFKKNDRHTIEKTADKKELEAKEGSIGAQISELEEQINTVNSEMAELKKQLEVAGKNREEEHAEYEKMVPEQTETQRLLKQALEVLGKFYKQQAAALVEIHAHPMGSKQLASEDAPAGFKTFRANSQGFGIMNMIQGLIADSKAAVAQAGREEASSLKDFESFKKETDASLEKKGNALADKQGQKAKAEKNKVQTRRTREGVESDLKNLGQTKDGLHDSCDFLTANFDVRQAARTEEMESVAKAKAILSGATFSDSLVG